MQGNSIREDIFAVQEHFSEECGVAGIFNKGELSPMCYILRCTPFSTAVRKAPE